MKPHLFRCHFSANVGALLRRIVIYCLSIIAILVVSIGANATSVTDSTGLQGQYRPTLKGETRILHLDSGILDTTQSSTTFLTNKICPNNFYPFVNLSIRKIDVSSSGIAALYLRACVKSYIISNNQYLVTYISQIKTNRGRPATICNSDDKNAHTGDYPGAYSGTDSHLILESRQCSINDGRKSALYVGGRETPTSPILRGSFLSSDPALTTNLPQLQWDVFCYPKTGVPLPYTINANGTYNNNCT